MMRFSLHAAAAAAAMAALCQCSTPTTSIRNADVVVSVKDQKLGIYKNGQLSTSYKISTSKFGIGDQPGSNRTPLGKHEVVAKIGHGLPAGAVLKSRQWNGEVVRPNAPGRDPIVSRILWLSGQESSNRNAYGRFIYIHGTTEEFRLGSPASYGCVRMAARDVIKVFDAVPIGASVVISRESLPTTEAGAPAPESLKPVPLPPLTPDSKPADPSAPVLAVNQPKINAVAGSGPMPVLVTKGARKNDPESALSSAPVPVAKTKGAAVATAASPPEPATKRRLFGFGSKKAAEPAVAAAAPTAPAAAAKPGKKSQVAAAPMVADPAKPGTKRRLFGFGGNASSDPVPAPPAAAATKAGPPKVAKTGKPGENTAPVPKATSTKKKPAKKVAGDSTDATDMRTHRVVRVAA